MDVVIEKKKMTSTERVAKYRRKRQLDSDYKLNESKRIEAVRKTRVQNMTDAKKKMYKACAAERQRKCRAKKKPATVVTNQSAIQETHGSSMDTTPVRKLAYKTPQAMGKAINKSLRSLPYSPTKKIAVVSGLANKFGLKIERKMQQELNPVSEIDKLVCNFYYRSDIVYTMPGIKDEMVIWNANGKKSRVRKYYLTMFLKEAHMIYESCNQKISFSKFSALRPKNVLLLKNSPIDQCKCKVHENFQMKLKALHIAYDGDWLKTVMCDSGYGNMESDCWKGKCSICGKNEFAQFTTNPTKCTAWQEWIKDSISGRIMKTVHEGCNAELQDIIFKELPSFREHVRIKRIQANAFEDDKQQSRVLQIDFAMAYSCDYQNEIQSALWSRDSVQLFTAALFLNGNCIKTFLVCSDTKDKGKNTVYAFLTKLYTIIMENNYQDIQDIIYSDGPSSEFKNKFMVKCLYLLSKKFKRSFQWKYFATSHGKGVVDGVGGKAKSLVRQKVMSKSQNSEIVQNSMDFARVASTVMTATTVLHMSQLEIDAIVDADRPWEDVANVTGVQRMHVMKSNFPCNEIKLWETNVIVDELVPDIQVTMLTLPITVDTSKNVNILELGVSDWCAVTYDNKMYAGEILSLTDKEVEVNVMVPAGKYWKWPGKADVLLYPIEKVIKKLSPPIVVGSRGQFAFQGI